MIYDCIRCKNKPSRGSVSSIHLFLAPEKGPTITKIEPRSTDFKITWTKLSADDSNGEITKYEVCYQPGSSVSDCTKSKEVIGADNTVTSLTGLEPATMYTIAVRAFTAVGPGPLGSSVSATTLESGRLINQNNLRIFSSSLC